MSGMVAIILVNPAVIAQSASSLAVTAFPCFSAMTPAVAAGGVSCASGAAISAAAALASALPVLALGGTIAVTAALLSQSFRESVAAKRRVNFTDEFDSIASSLKIGAADLASVKCAALPEFKEIMSEADRLRDEFKKLGESFAGSSELCEMGELLMRARVIKEQFKECRVEMAYAGYKLIDELSGRAKFLSDGMSEIIEKINKIPMESSFYTELISAAKKIRIPDFSNISMQKPDFNVLSETRVKLNGCEDAIKELNDKVLKAFQTLQMDDLIAAFIDKSRVQAQARELRAVARKTNKPAEVDIIDKINRMLSSLLFIEDNGEYSKILIRFEDIKKESDAERRIMLYDDFVIFCENLLKSERRRGRDKEDLNEMKRQLLCFDSPEVKKAALKIDEVLKSKGPADMPTIRSSIAEAFERDAAYLNSAAYAGVLKNAFAALGYETDEDFETIIINDKKAYIHKPAMKNYHIQLISNPDKNILQAEVVREVESESQAAEVSRTHEVRDMEVQAEFCEDYEKLLKSLESAGVAVSEKVRKKPGEIKVKKVAGICGAKNKARRAVKSDDSPIAKAVK